MAKRRFCGVRHFCIDSPWDRADCRLAKRSESFEYR